MKQNPSIAVVYLARGADINCFNAFKRFSTSYLKHNPGMDHSLYVIYKGFTTDHDLKLAKMIFRTINHTPLYFADNNFDIGAYIDCANIINEDWICVLNTTSEILSQHWLYKFSQFSFIPSVGLVGATGSYESLHNNNMLFPVFPNIHIRSTGFMIQRNLFCELTSGAIISDKIDALNFESGHSSLTNKILKQKKEVIVVGRNGRGYSPRFWYHSETFRDRLQSNLMIADKQTRNYTEMPWSLKKEISQKTWGKIR